MNLRVSAWFWQYIATLSLNINRIIPVTEMLWVFKGVGVEINASCLRLDDFPLYLLLLAQIPNQTGGKQLQNKEQCHATTVPQYI